MISPVKRQLDLVLYVEFSDQRVQRQKQTRLMDQVHVQSRMESWSSQSTKQNNVKPFFRSPDLHEGTSQFSVLIVDYVLLFLAVVFFNTSISYTSCIVRSQGTMLFLQLQYFLFRQN